MMVYLIFIAVISNTISKANDNAHKIIYSDKLLGLCFKTYYIRTPQK